MDKQEFKKVLCQKLREEYALATKEWKKHLHDYFHGKMDAYSNLWNDLNFNTEFGRLDKDLNKRKVVLKLCSKRQKKEG